MNYLCHLLVVCILFGLLGVALDLLVRVGLVSLCHAAFFGLGAYSAAWIQRESQCSFVAASASATFIGVLFSILISAPSLRLREDQFAVATFAIQIFAGQVFNNWESVTGGPAGIGNIAPPSFGGWLVDSPPRFLLLAASTACVIVIIVRWLICSPFGRLLAATRESETLVRSYGKNPVAVKLQVASVSSGIACLAGSLYASYVSYIDPGSFTLVQSIAVLAIVVIGGAGSRVGPWLGAAIFVGLPEAFRFLGLPTSTGPHLRQICFGATLVALMLSRPQGIAGRHD